MPEDTSTLPLAENGNDTVAEPEGPAATRSSPVEVHVVPPTPLSSTSVPLASVTVPAVSMVPP